MDQQIILLEIAAILIAARLFAELASRVKIPTIIGELVAGVILGPSLLGWIEPSETLKFLAELGIILLLFEVGIQTQLDKLISSGSKAAIVAVSGFVLPFILGFISSYWLFELPLIVSLFVGGTLTATSIGITVRILSELGKHNSVEGQIVLGAAVIDDLLGVFLLAVLYDFSSSGQVDLSNIAIIVFYVSIFFVLAPVLAKLATPFIKHLHRHTTIPGLIPTTLVSMVLIFAYLAHLSGAPDLLGGFVAGIALSRRFFLPIGTFIKADPEFSISVHTQMRPIIQLFTPIFFVMVGLSLDLRAVEWGSLFIWVFSLATLFIAIAGKMMGAFLIDEKNSTRLAIGMSMVPRGEVGLIFAEIGRSGGILDDTIYAGIILVIAYTTIASPIWIKHYYQLVENKSKKKPANLP
ncbi:MAG: cation:proton antiporter [Gammaproteobacteria bacterium]|nr:cation:proton antiporter [Gammaproteobacteria bacterium]